MSGTETDAGGETERARSRQKGAAARLMAAMHHA
jgi:hypothetical protein